MDRYIIEPMNFALIFGQGYLKAGDLIDMVTGDTIVGPYCAWPKQEPRYFIVTNKKVSNTLAGKLAKHLREKYESRN